MKVTITVKEVNPEFDHELAAREHDGKESEDNILYTWEDEFEISGDVKDFKIRNNAVYNLEVVRKDSFGEAEDEHALHPIEGTMIVDSILSDGKITSCVFSRSLVKDTKKVISKKGDVHFYVFLKGGKEIVTPVTGIYISAKDFPKDLPVPDEEE